MTMTEQQRLWEGDFTSLFPCDVYTICPTTFPYFYTMHTYLTNCGELGAYYHNYMTYHEKSDVYRADVYLIEKTFREHRSFMHGNISFSWSRSQEGPEHWLKVNQDLKILMKELEIKGVLK